MSCRVCSTPAIGFHYKINTCRACAAFFRRTKQMNINYVCKRKRNCVISQENRFNCRYCRMKKCLGVGMTIEDETGSKEAGFNPKEPSTSDLPSLGSDDFYTSENVFKNNEGFLEKLKERIFKILNKKSPPHNIIGDMYLVQQMDRAFKKHEKRWPRCKEALVQDSTFDMNMMVILFYREIEYSVELCSEIRPFMELPSDQKVAVIKNFLIKFMQIEQTWATVELLGGNPDDKRIVSIDGHVLNFHETKFDMSMLSDFSTEQIKELLLSSEIRYDYEFIIPFKLLKPDRFELLYLMTRSMWEIKGFQGISKETEEVAEGVMNQLADELYFYYKNIKKDESGLAKRIYRLHNLITALDRVAQMRKQDCRMSHVFNIFKTDVYLTDFIE